MSHRVEKSEQEWRHELTDEQYRVLRLKGTEPPFSGEYCDTETPGVEQMAFRGQRPEITVPEGIEVPPGPFRGTDGCNSLFPGRGPGAGCLTRRESPR